ncbi:MAG: class I SAM-dependent methyltransferase [Clostridia bacterium]|nr:class I SAM-dependent methyltransferase [Clostridia bacterium]
MFYESIARVYDYIFPQNVNQLNFIESIKPIEASEKILDIGCATGNLTELLSSKTNHAIGLDLDRVLLDYARIKYPNLEFIEENMLNITEICTQPYDRIVSFGNTLVHLDSVFEVEKFFRSVYQVLKTDGLFIVQMINYDRILDQNIDRLPTLDNDNIRFERLYSLKRDHIQFDTKLVIKAEQLEIENSILLLPLRKDTLHYLLNQIGFKEIAFYGTLSGDPLNINSIPLIFSCKKGPQ